MKSLTVFSLFFISLLTLSLLGCGASNNRESTGEYIDDTVITTKVKTAILNTPSLSVSEINVETFKGVVQLSGFVGSRAEITKASDVARAITGVSSVKNDIRIK